MISIKQILSLKKKITPLILHNWSPSISFYSNINAALVLQNCKLIEYSVLKFPKEYRLLEKNYFINNGKLFLKNLNGLGINFSKNDKAFEKKIINIYKCN